MPKFQVRRLTQGSEHHFIGYYGTLDPIRFENDLRVTIQSLGWKSGGRYNHLEDDIATVAYWYQSEPHTPFSDPPSPEKLVIKKVE